MPAKKSLTAGYCQTCSRPVEPSELVGVEYAYNSPERYDGISEWKHLPCGRREGRWTGKELADGELEKRMGDQ